MGTCDRFPGDPPCDRRGVADRVGEAHRGPRRSRTGRRDRGGAGAGRAGGRARAVAAGRRAGQPGCLADGHREAPRDGPAAPQGAAGPQARRARAGPGDRRAGHHGGGVRTGRGGGGRRHRGRPAAAGLHRLPPGAVHRGPRGAHPAAAGRPEDRRDRAGLPGRRADGRAADRPGQEDPRQGGRALRGAGRPGARGTAGVGAGSHLSDLQRGVRGDRRGRLDAPGAVRGRAAARAAAGRPDAQGAGGARPGRPDGDPGVAVRGAYRSRASRCCCRTRTAPGGTIC